MSNDYFSKSGSPSTGSQGSSSVMRSEFSSIESAFDKLPNLNNHANEVVFVNTGGTGLSSQNANTARTSLGLSIGNNVQAWDPDLDTLAALDATTGVLIRSAANNFVRRVVEGTANEVTVTNGNGVAGNITISLPSALTFSGKTVNGGTLNNVVLNNASIGGVVVEVIDSGTRMLFQQTSAPTGWTKVTNNTYNDSALRIQTGTVTTGGSDAFSTHFGSGKSTAGFTLTSAESAAHTHTGSLTGSSNSGAGAQVSRGGTQDQTVNYETGSTGGGGSHSHTLSNMDIKYADCIIASKD